LEKGSEVNAKSDDGETALISAARAKGDSVKLVELLMSKGADINAKDDWDEPP